MKHSTSEHNLWLTTEQEEIPKSFLSSTLLNDSKMQNNVKLKLGKDEGLEFLLLW